MRICILAPGQSTHTYNWIQYFAGRGHQIYLITFNEYQFDALENVIVYTIPPSFPDNIKIFSYIIKMLFGPFINAFDAIKLRKIIRKINPDILHAHSLSQYGSMGYFLYFPVFVVTSWGSDILIEPKKSLNSWIMAKLILNSAKLITCDSNAVRDECLRYCNQPEKVKVLLWGVDLTTFHERETTYHEKKIVILSTRDFTSIYNIDTIIESVHYVVEKCPYVKYVLKNTKMEQVAEFRDLASSMNVTEFIDFVSRYMKAHELPKLHYDADIFVSIPSSDSSSISLLEAMACGLPVIVSDIPANHEWVTDGWNGLIVPVRNPEKLAEAILHLIENPDLMQLFGKRNSQIIRDRADREKHMANMEGLYRQLLVNT
jgi:glycosyltransferase involved in cell wall biosynthesis